jgi:hypothetical protein
MLPPEREASRLDIALAAQADDVHLGQSDLPCKEARRLAPDLIIGVSASSAYEVRTGGTRRLGETRNPSEKAAYNPSALNTRLNAAADKLLRINREKGQNKQSLCQRDARPETA